VKFGPVHNISLANFVSTIVATTKWVACNILFYFPEGRRKNHKLDKENMDFNKVYLIYHKCRKIHHDLSKIVYWFKNVDKV